MKIDWIAVLLMSSIFVVAYLASVVKQTRRPGRPPAPAHEREPKRSNRHG